MRIQHKLFLILLLTTLALVGCMFGFVRWSLADGFNYYMENRQISRVNNLTTALSECYVRHDGWQILRENRGHWLELIWAANHNRQPPPEYRMLAVSDDSSWPPKRLPGYGYGANNAHFELRAMLLDQDLRVVVGRAELLEKANLHAIELDGETIGYLALLPGKPSLQPVDIEFFEQQSRSFLWIGMGMVLLSFILASGLVYWLSKPLKNIAGVVRCLAAGDYRSRLPVSSNDELGSLSGDINRLAEVLEQAKCSRQQWVADISHELRTPLSILRAELEALQDGIRPLDAGAVDLLLNDVLRLNRLTDDLYQLALGDQQALSYQCTRVEPLGLLEALLKSLNTEFEQKSLRLELSRPWPSRAGVWGDPDRLVQLFSNLLTNSLRYTDAGGCLRIGGRVDSGCLCLEFADSAPTVEPAELTRIFERFYRVEMSRSRVHGGAGLGLAMCQSIVEAHGGYISAGASELGGLRILVALPLLNVFN